MDSEETIRSYKRLSEFERAIRSMRSVDLKVRPIRHRLEPRIKAHSFLCMLAYDLQWHMSEAWRPLLFADEDQAGKAVRDPVTPAQRSEGALEKVRTKRLPDGSAVHALHTLLQSLSRLVRNTCRRLGSPDDEPAFSMDTPPDADQQRAYDLLDAITV